MLIALFPKLENMKFTHTVRAFFRSAYYPFIIAALMALSEIFALELPVYYIYILLGMACALLCDDTLGLLPIICCCYMTFAYQNSPHGMGGKTLFEPANLLQLVFLIGVAVVILVGRFITCVIERPNRKIPFLTFGFLALLAGYLLSGVGYPGYVAWKGIVFALAQVFALSAFYFFFYYTVDWETVKKSYIFTIFIAIGVGLLFEIGAMYTHEGVFQFKNDSWTVEREALGTGWGVYNNVGCIMAMCIPAPMYFAVKNEKWGWAFSLLGCLFMLGVAFTQSRGSILCGGLVFVACVVAVLVCSRGKNRIFNAVVFGSMLLALIISIVLFSTEMGGIFSSIKETIMHIIRDEDISNNRFPQYEASWKEFTEHPFFGVGFHNLGSGGFAHLKDSVLVPPRTHNTVLQLLASGGIVAFATYLFHRAQTFWLWLKRPNFEKTIAALIIAVLLLTSLLDCHFFNYGPGLLYGCVLAYMECRGGTSRSC